MPGDGQQGPRFCGDCGAPTPQHWPDCLTLQERAAGVEVVPSYSDQSPRRCPRCGSVMTRNHDGTGQSWTDNCTGMCGVTLDAAGPAAPARSSVRGVDAEELDALMRGEELPPDPISPAAGFDAIAAMPGAQVFEEPYPGEGELCASCQKPVRPETGGPYVQDGERFFHTGPCWTERLREAGP